MFIKGEAAPENLKSRIQQDEVFNNLIQSNSTNEEDTGTVVNCMFQARVDLLQRVASDHLDAGMYHHSTSSSTWARNHTKFSEELIGHLTH